VAEDQAEDTFGEYPPFAMTGYSQGGYVASASTTSSYVVYDNSASTFYSFGQHYGPTGGSGAYNRSPPTNHGGNVLSGDAIPNGEWHKIQMPHKLKLGSLGIRPRNVGYNGEPVNWYLYGSNDDVNWTMLYKKTDSTVPDDALETQYSVNATSGFSYFLIVMTKSAGYEFLNVAEFNWYGHRENDLVRLPDPTNVLKYPHVVMTGPAQRGYRVSVSSVYAPRNQREGWMAFNDSLSVPGGHWQNNESTVKYGAGTGVPTNDCAVFPPGGTTKGEWIKLELPFKLKVSSIFIVTAPAHEAVEKAILYGSNDDSNWDVVKPEFTTTLSTFGTKRSTTESVTTSNYYKYLVLQVTKADATGGGNNGRAIQIYTLNYYGIQEDISIPIQIGGGNIDKVANFRVYDKFVDEDQALEIWDAQKDEFGRVKSSMTLQKGRLGIGTTEPEGRLAVLDEPDTTYGIQEFPPRAISVLDYDTHIVGHGKFEFYSSQGTWTNSYRGTSDWDFTRVFTPRFTTEGGWHGDSVSTPGTYQIVGVYAPAITSGDGLIQSTLKDGSVVYGDWIAMRTPYAINVTRIATAPRLNYGKARGIGKFIILGSNNGVDWEHTGSGAIAPHDMSSATDAGGYGTRQSETIAHVSTNSNGYYYTYHRLVATHIMGHRSASGHPQYQVGGESLNQAYLRFFGTREQLPPKQSVLHDGQLTLTKNLTVPSIGPSVTNTRHVVPRRHKLVLEFDTSTNPTDLTTVNDTSEMGNDGTLRGNAYYSIGDKAFVFDGSGDYVDTGVISPSMAGARPHSMSAWFKTNATSLQYVTCLGEKNGTATDRRFSSIRVNGNALQFWQYSNDLTKSNVIHVGLWYHAVAVYIGGGTSQSTMLMYLNGEQITSWDIDTTDGNNLGLVSPSFAVGEDIGRSNYYFNGQISKPTLYDTALTAGDVKTLYDMGRGDSYHVTNFQNTLVGINLGNGRAPRSALDVRDQIYARTTTIDTFTGQHICFPDESMEKGLIVSAKKNKFVKLNGLATGKSAITIDESLPIVSLSNVVQDKACFGVVSKMEESNAAYRTEITGGLVSESVKIVGDNRAIVNSVGEGAIWVVDTNGPLESGDYITTSNVAGYGQKQDSEFLANYSVAKITMDCDFTASNVAVQTIKREETGTRIITEDAWNQLVEYDRYSNVEDEITTYYQIQRGENVLDDNGQLQFEDKTGATEEPYERRFLTTDGTQTDEANAVHIAAFVGCTYHCG